MSRVLNVCFTPVTHALLAATDSAAESGAMTAEGVVRLWLEERISSWEELVA